MHSLPKNVQKLIDHFVRLPGIGPKTASRLVLYLLHAPNAYVTEFASTLEDVKKNIKFCEQCFNLSEEDLCNICLDEGRDGSTIIVVEDILDLIAFETMGDYRGVYHVLGGVISPIQGVGPDDLHLQPLFARIRKLNGQKVEVIVATNPNLEGEATAAYIKTELNKFENKNLFITRIARGLPTGAELDYADKVTLLKSLQGRAKI